MTLRLQPTCSDCESRVDRRTFIAAVGGSALLGVTAPALLGTRAAYAAPTPQSAAESAVARFYATLSDEQKKGICFPFEHELRRKISANWHITGPKIDDAFYNKEQRALIEEIVRKVTSEDGYQRMKKQMDDDDGGLGAYSVAVFGSPESKQCEWELTGRHLTLRADGNSVDKAAFGGPIIYGHGEEDPKDNLFNFQTKQANEVFRALDAKQAAKALIPKAPNESSVSLQGAEGTFPGIAVGDLSDDQKKLVESTLKVLMSPYRTEDVDEVMEIVKAAGGMDKLHMAFYEQEDIGGDKVWDIWRVEGPSFVWHFRGAPHVHAYINIGVKS